MYDVFKGYLARPTWHTGHPTDDQVFYAALATVVQEPLFNADDMGDHFRAQKNVDLTDPSQQAFIQAVDDRVAQAHAVREFLDYNSIVI